MSNYTSTGVVEAPARPLPPRAAPSRERPGGGSAAGMWREMMEGWFDAYDAAVDTFERGMTLRPRDFLAPRRSCDCCTPSCGCGEPCRDRCHCRCCVSDADLVVYARVGEQRVVPIRIENPRRRSREIKLELSEFTTSGGYEAPVLAEVVGEREFELEPCGERDIIVVVRPALHHLNKGEEHATADRDFGDVDDCVVAYADLRVTGCDVRPIRIAVAVLPRDCDAYDVRCGCGCC